VKIIIGIAFMATLAVAIASDITIDIRSTFDTRMEELRRQHEFDQEEGDDPGIHNEDPDPVQEGQAQELSAPAAPAGANEQVQEWRSKKNQ
jgi:hypothetical protein